MGQRCNHKGIVKYLEYNNCKITIYENLWFALYAVVSKYNDIIYIMTFTMIPAIKYIGVNLRKCVNCLYLEYYKMSWGIAILY